MLVSTDLQPAMSTHLALLSLLATPAVPATTSTCSDFTFGQCSRHWSSVSAV